MSDPGGDQEFRRGLENYRRAHEEIVRLRADLAAARDAAPEGSWARFLLNWFPSRLRLPAGSPAAALRAWTGRLSAYARVGWYPSSHFDLSPLQFPVPLEHQWPDLWIINDCYPDPVWPAGHTYPMERPGLEWVEATRLSTIEDAVPLSELSSGLSAFGYDRLLTIRKPYAQMDVLFLGMSDEELLSAMEAGGLRLHCAAITLVGGVSQLLWADRAALAGTLGRLGVKWAVSTAALEGFSATPNVGGLGTQNWPATLQTRD